MKHILIPTDFSENSWNATAYAVHLFQNEECTFHLFHSYTPLIYHVEYVLINPAQYGLGDTRRDTAVKNLESLKKRILEQLHPCTNHTFETVARFDSLVNGISQLLTERMIDFIVMGTKGATGAEEFLFGSNTVQVFKQLKCPMIVVPTQFQYKAPSNILFSTDYNRFYCEAELQPLKAIVDLHKATINILHVNPKLKLNDIQNYNMTMLCTYLNQYRHCFYTLPSPSKKSKAIEEFIEELHIDMLVMVKYNHSLVEALFNEPIIKKLVFHPSVPILIIPDITHK